MVASVSELALVEQLEGRAGAALFAWIYRSQGGPAEAAGLVACPPEAAVGRFSCWAAYHTLPRNHGMPFSPSGLGLHSSSIRATNIGWGPGYAVGRLGVADVGPGMARQLEGDRLLP